MGSMWWHPNGEMYGLMACRYCRRENPVVEADWSRWNTHAGRRVSDDWWVFMRYWCSGIREFFFVCRWCLPEAVEDMREDRGPWKIEEWEVEPMF